MAKTLRKRVVEQHARITSGMVFVAAGCFVAAGFLAGAIWGLVATGLSLLGIAFLRG